MCAQSLPFARATTKRLNSRRTTRQSGSPSSSLNLVRLHVSHAELNTAPCCFTGVCTLSGCVRVLAPVWSTHTSVLHHTHTHKCSPSHTHTHTHTLSLSLSVVAVDDNIETLLTLEEGPSIFDFFIHVTDHPQQVTNRAITACTRKSVCFRPCCYLVFGAWCFVRLLLYSSPIRAHNSAHSSGFCATRPTVCAPRDAV